MMSEPTKVDGITTDELTGKIVLLIEEKRPWHETNLMHRQLAAKIKNYVRHIRSPQFHQKHGKRPKDTIVRLVTAQRPADSTLQLLERIGYELQKFDIEFEYETAGEGMLGPTPIKPASPPRTESPGTQTPSPEAPQRPRPAQPPPPTPGPTQPPDRQPPPAARSTPGERPQAPDAPAGKPPEREPGAGARPPGETLPEQPHETRPPTQEPSGAQAPPGAMGSDAGGAGAAADPFLEYLQAEQEREAAGAEGAADARGPTPEAAEPKPAAHAPRHEEPGTEGGKEPEIFPEEEFGRLIEYEGADDDHVIVESGSGKRTSLGRAGDAAGSAPPPPMTYAEQVAMEKPSIWKALLAGLTAAVSGAFLWGMMAAAVGHGVSPVAIAVGFMVGWSIRVRVRGRTLTYRIVAVIFTVLGSLLGSAAAASAVVALNAGTGLSGIIATISDQAAILSAIGQVYGLVDLVAYGIALYLAFRISTTSETE